MRCSTAVALGSKDLLKRKKKRFIAYSFCMAETLLVSFRGQLADFARRVSFSFPAFSLVASNQADGIIHVITKRHVLHSYSKKLRSYSCLRNHYVTNQLIFL